MRGAALPNGGLSFALEDQEYNNSPGRLTSDELGGLGAVAPGRKQTADQSYVNISDSYLFTLLNNTNPKSALAYRSMLYRYTI